MRKGKKPNNAGWTESIPQSLLESGIRLSRFARAANTQHLMFTWAPVLCVKLMLSVMSNLHHRQPRHLSCLGGGLMPAVKSVSHPSNTCCHHLRQWGLQLAHGAPWLVLSCSRRVSGTTHRRRLRWRKRQFRFRKWIKRLGQLNCLISCGGKVLFIKSFFILLRYDFEKRAFI